MALNFAQRLNNVKTMLAGIAAHMDQLGKRGITPEILAKENQNYEQIEKLQILRNALKARSQEATVQVEQLIGDVESFCSEARKLVRLDFPKETWPEFGFRYGEYAGQTETKQPETNAKTSEKNT